MFFKYNDKFYIDPENMSPEFEWGQEDKWSVNSPSHNWNWDFRGIFRSGVTAINTTEVFTCSSPCFAFFGGDDEVVVDALGRFLLEFLTGEGVMLSRFSSTSRRLL